MTRCCIDKTSTAELSEAINSMFRWYRESKICYAYLSDVSDASRFTESRWFTRGWTLQELVAPYNICFYDVKWYLIGTKLSLQAAISERTRIAEKVLATGEFDYISIAQRFSWAADRETTRTEDLAYCLLGMFNVNMPLLYGEGEKAFRRIQEEIMKISDDQSLFAWGLSDSPRTMQQFIETYRYRDSEQRNLHGLFARSPRSFTYAHRIRLLETPRTSLPPILTNNGVRIELQLLRPKGITLEFAAIFCSVEGNYSSYLGFPLSSDGKGWKSRLGELVLIHTYDLVSSDAEVPYRDPYVCFIKQPSTRFIDSPRFQREMKLVLIDRYGLYEQSAVLCSANAEYSPRDQTIRLPADLEGLHAVVYFSPSNTREVPFRLLRQGSKKRKWIQAHAPELVYHHSVAKIKLPKGTLFTSIQPTFGILVGGNLSYPWVRCVLVHNDDEPKSTFDGLVEMSREDVLSTRTASRSHLEMLLHGHADDLLLLDNLQFTGQLVASWEYDRGSAFLDRNQPEQPTITEFKKRSGRYILVFGLIVNNSATGSEYLFARASIETSQRNLVESAYTLRVETSTRLPFDFHDPDPENWWASAQARMHFSTTAMRES
jgi:hypothetical protein